MVTSHKLLAESLHHGKWAGTASRIAWLVFGMAGTAMLVAGAMVYARRTERDPAAADGGTKPLPASMPRRVWRGMGVGKWALPVAAAAIVAVGIYELGPYTDKWQRVRVAEQNPLGAILIVRHSLRAGSEFDVRIRIPGGGPAMAQISLDGGPPREVTLQAGPRGATGSLRLVATNQRNRLLLTLPGTPGESIWTLGKPPF